MVSGLLYIPSKPCSPYGIGGTQTHVMVFKEGVEAMKAKYGNQIVDVWEIGQATP